MYILPFISPEATLESAGGKGANLVRLTRAGFDVPRGFIVSTAAYREFVHANGLDAIIGQALEELEPEDAGGLENASQAIREAMSTNLCRCGVYKNIFSAAVKASELRRQKGGA